MRMGWIGPERERQLEEWIRRNPERNDMGDEQARQYRLHALLLLLESGVGLTTAMNTISAAGR